MLCGPLLESRILSVLKEFGGDELAVGWFMACVTSVHPCVGLGRLELVDHLVLGAVHLFVWSASLGTLLASSRVQVLCGVIDVPLSMNVMDCQQIREQVMDPTRP